MKQQRRNLVNGCEGIYGTARKLDLFYQIKRAIGSYEEKRLLTLFQNELGILNNIML